VGATDARDRLQRCGADANAVRRGKLKRGEMNTARAAGVFYAITFVTWLLTFGASRTTAQHAAHAQ